MKTGVSFRPTHEASRLGGRGIRRRGVCGESFASPLAALLDSRAYSAAVTALVSRGSRLRLRVARRDSHVRPNARTQNTGDAVARWLSSRYRADHRPPSADSLSPSADHLCRYAAFLL